MPSGADYKNQPKPIRIFAYGLDHVRKTTWALQAALAGFRVLLFNFDRGADVVALLPPEALQRVYIIDAYDGPLDAFASRVATEAFRNYRFWLHEESRQISIHARPGFVRIDMNEFGADTVVVCDSYTALAKSYERNFAFAQKIDLGEGNKQEWPGYGFCGRALTFFLSQIKGANFNTITIGHLTTYEKHKKDPQTGKPLPEIEFQREQPVSSSNPHAQTITRDFSEVLKFTKKGNQVWIDTSGDDESAGGSRVLKPGVYRFEDLSFGAIAEVYGIKLAQPASPFHFEVTPEMKQPGAAKMPVLGQQEAAKPIISPIAPVAANPSPLGTGLRLK